jgi:hypothetical protein
MLNELGRAGFSRLQDDSDEFVFMDTYVFVVALSGVEYVNPAFPNLEGRNLLDYKDAAGNFLVKEMIDKTENAAKNTSGQGRALGSPERVNPFASSRRTQFIVIME